MDTSRQTVVANIQKCVAEGRFNDKVEPGDPNLNHEQLNQLMEEFVARKETWGYKLNNYVARTLAWCVTHYFGKDLVIEGLEKVKGIEGAAIVTSNHFAPFENTFIRLLAEKNDKKLSTVSQDTNCAMGGLLGYLMNYTDIIPLSRDPHYMETHFEQQLQEAVDKKQWVLMYPEQEMWWNYRKVRPLKRGVYFYASKLNVPVVSCFVEMQETPSDDSQPSKISYVLHVLDPIYPDPGKTLRAGSLEMMQKDYEQKKAAYERAYGKPLDYAFDEWDIAGWSSQNSLTNN